MRFEELAISPQILRAIQTMGYEEATPIQAETIPAILEGRDIIGQAQTGTGKTAAFAIPVLEKVDPDNRSLQALILCPTRELAIQIAGEFRKLTAFTHGIKLLPVYGGQDIGKQIRGLKGAQIVIGTPGRVMYHMRRRTIKAEQIRMVVLDEADEMLNMGFREDIDLILSQMPVPRQTVLFSATMPEPILQLAKDYMENPVQIRVTPEEQLTADQIDQCYFEMKAKMKPEALCRLLTYETPERSLIFCNTKKQVDALTQLLQSRDFKAEGLHGDLKQAQRDLVMKHFRSGATTILIATDIAARGLDIQGIDIVFNYDLPEENEAYVHRIGRTARAGHSGRAFTFVVGKELNRLRELMEFAGVDIRPRALPTLQDIEANRATLLIEDIRARKQRGVSKKYRTLAESLIADGTDPVDVLAAFFEKELYTPESSAKDDLLSRAPTRVTRDDYASSSMTKLHLNAGKKEQIRVKDIVGAVAGETGIPGSALGTITILEHFSYLEVPSEVADDVLTIMNQSEIKGRRVKFSLAKE
jgi:ATP-dependent RNA helicase DeaD